MEHESDTHRAVEGGAFGLLGLEPRVVLDRDTIERAYLGLAGSLHPDVARGDTEALLKVADLNRARQTLLDDESRANAVLAIRGGPSADECRELPEGFLLEIMEAREQAEEAASAQDDTLVRELRGWAGARREAHLGIVSGLLDRPDPAPEALRSARIELNAWRYIERMLEQVEEKRSV